MEGQVVADVDDVAAVGLDVPVMDSRCGGLRIPVGVGPVVIIPVTIIPVDVGPVGGLPEFMIPDGFMQQTPLSQDENEQKNNDDDNKGKAVISGATLGITDLGWLWGGACRLWGGGLFPGLAGLLLEADLFFVAHLFRGGAVVDGAIGFHPLPAGRAVIGAAAGAAAFPVIVVVLAAGGAADVWHISVLLSFSFIIQDAGWVYHLFEVAQGGFRGQL